MLVFQDPILNQPNNPLLNKPEKFKGSNRIKKMLVKILSVGDLYTPIGMEKEVEAFKKKYQYVQIIVKGLSEIPTTAIPSKI